MSNDVREQLADVQHSIWSHWMTYMLNQGTYNADGTWTMPADKVERWQRQAGLKYSGLTEREKESDRNQADKIILKIRHLLEGATLADVYAKRAETAEARVLALEVERSKLVKLRDDTDNVLWLLKPNDVSGAINWGDLGCRETQEVVNEERYWYRVIIEEADPNNPALHDAVLAGLVARGWSVDDLEIETAW